MRRRSSNVVAAADEVSLTVFDKDFGGFVPGVEVGGHLETIGAGIAKDEVVPFADFADAAVPGEGVGLADIADDGIAARFAVEGC